MKKTIRLTESDLIKLVKKIGGFKVTITGNLYYQGPADDCWVWLDDHFN